MIEFPTRWVRVAALAALCAAGLATAQVRPVRNGDYIVAVVNSELVTAGEIDQRTERVEAEAARTGRSLPPEAELRQRLLDALIDERALVTYARDSGMRVDEPEIDRAVQSIAAQNQLTTAALRERLRAEGEDWGAFRANLRDQLLVERVREREVYARISVSEAEIDRAIEQWRAKAAAEPRLDIAQILVAVPDGADAATVEAQRAKAEAALARALGGAPFEPLVRELSDGPNREQGGAIGLRLASRLPDSFVAAVRDLRPGQVAPALLRSGAGFHVLKLVERRTAGPLQVTETHARHVLLRTSDEVTPETAAARLAEYRRQIESGATTFEQVARRYSEDGSASAGGDLGWTGPGTYVPEFEEAMNRLPNGGISMPVASRFGVHLIQVIDRRQVDVDPKQLREQARNQLREQKFNDAYAEWLKDLRSRAYIEMREPPQ